MLTSCCRDTRARSWAKSIVWRLVGVVILGALMFAVTQNWEQTSIVTVVFHVVRVVLYYWHERAWEMVSWGKL